MFKVHSAIMLLIDAKTGNIIDANISACKFYGYTLDEFKIKYLKYKCFIKKKIFKIRLRG